MNSNEAHMKDLALPMTSDSVNIMSDTRISLAKEGESDLSSQNSREPLPSIVHRSAPSNAHEAAQSVDLNSHENVSELVHVSSLMNEALPDVTTPRDSIVPAFSGPTHLAETPSFGSYTDSTPTVFSASDVATPSPLATKGRGLACSDSSRGVQSSGDHCVVIPAHSTCQSDVSSNTIDSSNALNAPGGIHSTPPDLSSSALESPAISPSDRVLFPSVLTDQSLLPLEEACPKDTADFEQIQPSTSAPDSTDPDAVEAAPPKPVSEPCLAQQPEIGSLTQASDNASPTAQLKSAIAEERPVSTVEPQPPVREKASKKQITSKPVSATTVSASLKAVASAKGRPSHATVTRSSLSTATGPVRGARVSVVDSYKGPRASQVQLKGPRASQALPSSQAPPKGPRPSQVKALSAPKLPPRQTRASLLRSGQVAPTENSYPAASPVARKRLSNAVYSPQVPGYKRQLNIVVSSVAQPKIVPRMNRAGHLRLQNASVATAPATKSAATQAHARSASSLLRPTKSSEVRSKNTLSAADPSAESIKSNSSTSSLHNASKKPFSAVRATAKRPSIVPRTNRAALLRAAK